MCSQRSAVGDDFWSVSHIALVGSVEDLARTVKTLKADLVGNEQPVPGIALTVQLEQNQKDEDGALLEKLKAGSVLVADEAERDQKVDVPRCAGYGAWRHTAAALLGPSCCLHMCPANEWCARPPPHFLR